MAKHKEPVFAVIEWVLYDFDVAVSLGQSDEEFRSSMCDVLPADIFKEELPNILNLSEYTTGRTLRFSSGATVLRMPNRPSTCEDYGVLAHEIFHAVHFMFERIGLRLCRKSDEAYAHAIGYLTREIYKLI